MSLSLILSPCDASNFGEYLKRGEKSANTVSKYTRDIRFFIERLAGRALDKNAALEYKAELIKKYKAASVNSIIAALNCFFEFLGMNELKLKSVKIQRSIFSRPERELTEAEYKRLLKAAHESGNERLYYITETIAATGIRISELRHITAESVKSGRAVISCKGKIRQIILPRPLCAELKKYAKSRGIKSGSIFVTRSGKPVDRSNVWSEMKKLCKSANVSEKKVFPHNLRHLFARKFYAAERDIVRLADILGHSSVNTTRIYTTESGDVHRSMIERMGMVITRSTT